MPAELLYEGNFEPSADGHGGQHRALQVVELIARAGYTPVRLGAEYSWGRGVRWSQGAWLALRGHVQNLRRMIPALGHHLDRVRTALPGRRPVVVWESTANWIFAEAAKAAGVAVIAVPQNLESLVRPGPDPLSGEEIPASLEHELRALGVSDAVFTISREEQWLLALRGVDADFLPYHPAPALSEKLLRIRNLRQPNERFLMLGTVYNPPTEAGMREQLSILERIAEQQPLSVDVAGFGTERLARDSKTLRFLGAVSPEQLDGLLKTTRGLLLHQRAAAGAITRIAEMLTAGVPVMGNPIACRSAIERAGVHVYSDERELAALLRDPPPTPPPPAAPSGAEERFMACVRRLAS
jgi:hypothetical protein